MATKYSTDFSHMVLEAAIDLQTIVQRRSLYCNEITFILHTDEPSGRLSDRQTELSSVCGRGSLTAEKVN